MASSFKWNGKAGEALVRKLLYRKIVAAAMTVARAAKVLLSVAGTGGGGGRNAKGRFKAGPGRPSSPGEPPRKQTGRLRGSVAWEGDEATLTARVGTNVRYGRWLELGTRFIRARPWLRRALAESRAAINAIFSRTP